MLSAMAHGNTRFYRVGNQDIAPGFEGLVAYRYIQQEKSLIRANLEKFKWYGAADNHRVMSDRGIFAQADYILHEQMGAIPRKPDFRRWVRLDLLPIIHPVPGIGCVQPL
jgi:hypothetical protein